MGGTTAARSVDVKNYSSEVNRRNPLEIDLPTLRTQTFNPNDNDKLLERSLDLIEERRKNAMVQLAYYQHKLKQGYDARVKLRPLELGDLVLKKVLDTAKNPT